MGKGGLGMRQESCVADQIKLTQKFAFSSSSLLKNSIRCHSEEPRDEESAFSLVFYSNALSWAWNEGQEPFFNKLLDGSRDEKCPRTTGIVVVSKAPRLFIRHPRETCFAASICGLFRP
jgi:hypothetical protein